MIHVGWKGRPRAKRRAGGTRPPPQGNELADVRKRNLNQPEKEITENVSTAGRVQEKSDPGVPDMEECSQDTRVRFREWHCTFRLSKFRFMFDSIYNFRAMLRSLKRANICEALK